MDRINTPTKAVNLFGAGKHGFKDGDLGLGIYPTDFDAAFFNDLQEELLTIIEAAGLVPTAGTRTQVYQAIQLMIAEATQDYKVSVRAATTAPINLAAPGAAIDGVAMVAGNRFLDKDNVTGSLRGIYIWNGAAVAATRATDADGVGELTSGAIVSVEEGTDNADSQWMLTTDGAITIGTTALTFARKDGSIVPDASETVKGKVELATNAEAQAFTADKVIDGAKLNTALKGSNQSLNSSGYQKFPGGLIIQWGRVTTNGSSDATLTFPVAFPTALLAAIPGGAGGNYYAYKETARSLTAVSHNLTVSSTGGAAASVTYDIIAIGY